MTPFEFERSRYPATPGCYLLRDGRGTLLYIGKAKNLRARLASHFAGGPSSHLTRHMPLVRDVEVILVRTELESLVLENILIKHHRPRLNRALMDEDSGYFHIVLTDEPHPRFVPYRPNRMNKALGRAGIARRLGPYAGRRYRDALLTFVVDTFGIRTCHPLATEICLRFHLGHCGGACESLVSPADERAAIDAAASFLTRRPSALIRDMRDRMLMHAKREQYEPAERIRRQVVALESTLQAQVVDRDVDHDEHAVWFGERSALVIECTRGAMHGVRLYPAPDGPDAFLAERYAFLAERYASGGPQEVFVSRAAVRRPPSGSVRIRVPRTAAGRDLLRLAKLNHDYRTTG